MTLDAGPEHDPQPKNNKLINNRSSGFATPVEEGGTETKVQANDRPAGP